MSYLKSCLRSFIAGLAPSDYYASLGLTETKLVEDIVLFYKLASCGLINMDNLDKQWSPLVFLFGNAKNLDRFMSGQLKELHERVISEMSGMRKEQKCLL